MTTFQFDGEVDYFELDPVAYAPALGEKGMASYRARFDEIAADLGPKPPDARNRECGCDSDCWCRRTALGRAVKWWFPGRLVGLRRKNDALAAWKKGRAEGS